jgi:prevent-host-death family protein
MDVVNIHEAKTHLSKLVDQAAKGESFIIAKAGKPLVKVTALDAPTGRQTRRLGFLAGQFSVPDDFDRMFEKEIEQMFYGDE